MKIFGYNWECCMEGGRLVHPDQPYMWYDANQIQIKDNELQLSVAVHPTTIIYENEVYNPTYGCGLLRSVEEFGYGTFEAEIKMPKGQGLWSALWLCGVGDWPGSGEIDLTEGYSEDSNYFRFFTSYFPWINPSWKIPNNIHYKQDGEHRQVGPRGVSIFKLKKDPSDEFVKYKCIWTPSRISIYINDKLSREDTKVVRTFQSDCMNVIFDVVCEAPEKYGVHTDSPLIIKNFTYKPL